MPHAIRTFSILLLLASASTIFGHDAVPGDAKDIAPILVGSPLPELILHNSTGAPVELKKLATSKPTVIVFYRGGWCPFCNVHLRLLQDALPELKKMGYQLIAISPDKPENLKATHAKQEIGYTLLSDSEMKAAAALGIRFKLSNDLLAKYKEYNIDLEAATGKTHHELPVPSVFVIGSDGRITFHYVNPDYRYRLSGELLIAAARHALGDEPLKYPK